MADDSRQIPPAGAIRGGVATALAHDSAAKHVSGEAVYVDDIPELPGTLMAYVLMSDRPHARIAGIDHDAGRGLRRHRWCSKRVDHDSGIRQPRRARIEHVVHADDADLIFCARRII